MNKTITGLLTALAVLTSASSGFAANEVKSVRGKLYYKGKHGNSETGVLMRKDRARGTCIQCHFSSGRKYSLFADNDNDFCYSCHAQPSLFYPLQEEKRSNDGFFDTGRWPGKNVYEESAHYKGGNLVAPGTKYEAGDCKNCHAPHGSPYKAMLKGPYDRRNMTICLNCHGRKGYSISMKASSRRIEAYYSSRDFARSGPGHRITRSAKQRNDFSNSKLSLHDPLPCYDCHNPHGSRGGKGLMPNGSLISDQRAEWDGLADTLSDPSQARKFCFGCHVESDGVPFSKEVEGIRMNRIPVLTSPDEHSSMGTASCNQCHGGDYSDERSLNVHNIGYGR